MLEVPSQPPDRIGLSVIGPVSQEPKGVYRSSTGGRGVPAMRCVYGTGLERTHACEAQPSSPAQRLSVAISALCGVQKHALPRLVDGDLSRHTPCPSPCLPHHCVLTPRIEAIDIAWFSSLQKEATPANYVSRALWSAGSQMSEHVLHASRAASKSCFVVV